MGIAGPSQDPIDYGPPSLSFTNFGGLSDGTASVSRASDHEFHRRRDLRDQEAHNLTFGYLYRRLQQNTLSYPNARGSFSFSGLLTSEINANGSRFGHRFRFCRFSARACRNRVPALRQQQQLFPRLGRRARIAQDDWRISRGLSFNLGIRYEYFCALHRTVRTSGESGREPAVHPVAVVTSGQTAPYSGSVPSSLVRPDDNNFSPRFGFAYRPFKKKSTVVRGGYSIFYSGSAYGQIASQMASQPPFAQSASLSTSTAYPLTLQNGFPVIANQTITNSFAIDPNYRLAYAQTWVFAVQQHAAARPADGTRIHRHQRNATSGSWISPTVHPRRIAAQSADSVAHRQRDFVQLPELERQFELQRRTGAAHSAFQARHCRSSRSTLTRNRSMTPRASADPAARPSNSSMTCALERGLSTFDQRHKSAA